MMRFQEDTARHLFRMQIIGPDGTPIETAEQMQSAQMQQAQAQSALPPRPATTPDSAGPLFGGQPDGPAQPRLSSSGAAAPVPPDGPAAKRPVPIPARATPTTTIDALEREFQQKKKRELDQARAAGSAASSNGNAPRVSGEKVGRNDPCPCGSGKKYKKCHGAQA